MLFRQTLCILGALLLAFGAGAQQTRVITNQGLQYSPDTLQVSSNDSVEFDVGPTHPTVQVSAATYAANGGTPLQGGFDYQSGAGTFLVSDVAAPGETIYYVCQAHVGSGMKGVIEVEQSSAQDSAEIFVLHNSPDPAAATVDIYAEIVGSDTLKLDNVAYRDAAQISLDGIPTGDPTEVVVFIAGEASTGPMGSLISDTLEVTGGNTYVVAAKGVVDPSLGMGLGADDTLGLHVAAVPNFSPSMGQTSLIVYHGAGDVEPVIVANDANDNELTGTLAYGEFSSRIDVPSDAYDLRLDLANVADSSYGTFSADLSGLDETELVVYASGFVSNSNVMAYNDTSSFQLRAYIPSTNQNIVLQPASASVEAREGAVEGLRVFPNPVAGDQLRLQFALEQPTQRLQARVLDLSGRVVTSSQWGRLPTGAVSTTLPIGDVQNGYYLLELRDGRSVSHRSIRIAR
jgi:plastocyanin